MELSGIRTSKTLTLRSEFIHPLAKYLLTLPQPHQLSYARPLIGRAHHAPSASRITIYIEAARQGRDQSRNETLAHSKGCVLSCAGALWATARDPKLSSVDAGRVNNNVHLHIHPTICFPDMEPAPPRTSAGDATADGGRGEWRMHSTAGGESGRWTPLE